MGNFTFIFCFENKIHHQLILSPFSFTDKNFRILYTLQRNWPFGSDEQNQQVYASTNETITENHKRKISKQYLL